MSGNGLDEDSGSVVEEAGIIDVIPTIARFLGIEFRTEGRSVVR